MKYIKLIGALFASTLLAGSALADTTNAPVAASASTNQWVLTLDGNGATTTSGNSQSAVGFEFGLGRTFSLDLPVLNKSVAFEGGLRQGFSYLSEPSTTLFSTKGYLDVTLFTYKQLELLAGGNVGLTYGNTHATWTAAPEALVKYWLKKDVALYGGVEYPFNLNDGRAENVLNYKLGVQIRF